MAPKAETMALGANPRFAVTSPDCLAESLYRDLYCARGQDEIWNKADKNAFASDRTSDHSFLASHQRLFLRTCVLHQSLRTEAAGGTASRW
jgi:hypothetical protein